VRSAILAVIASVVAGGAAQAEFVKGPYPCYLPPFNCVCGYNEDSGCRQASDGNVYCVTNSECYCQSNIGNYQYCGHWAVSWNNPFRKRRPPALFTPRNP
jgi:hypothetical protein